MGRWFGYRPRYEDICKIYLTEFLIDDFREYYEAEEELREQLFNMKEKDMGPTLSGLQVSMRSPAAANKLRDRLNEKIN